MATIKAVKKSTLNINKSGKLATKVISGTVLVDGFPAERKILIYLSINDSLLGSLISDSSGEFSSIITAGRNDRIRVLCVGEPGENSQVFEHVE